MNCLVFATNLSLTAFSKKFYQIQPRGILGRAKSDHIVLRSLVQLQKSDFSMLVSLFLSNPFTLEKGIGLLFANGDQCDQQCTVAKFAISLLAASVEYSLAVRLSTITN